MNAASLALFDRRVQPESDLHMTKSWTYLCVALLVILPAGSVRAADAAPVRFSRDVLPILAENCFLCHGPDEKARKAKLRLDTPEGAARVVTKGQSGESELIRRIHAAADDGGMPPVKANRRLSLQQKETLRRWIDEGAVWGKHWAFET